MQNRSDNQGGVPAAADEGQQSGFEREVGGADATDTSDARPSALGTHGSNARGDAQRATTEDDRLEATRRENTGAIPDGGTNPRRTYDERNDAAGGRQTTTGQFGARPEPTRTDKRPPGNAGDASLGQVSARYYGQGGGEATSRAPSTEGPGHAHGYYGDVGGQARASHAGRGPRGYSRPDTSIYEEICERLTEHHDLDASELEVRVEGGLVTLDGVIESRYAKRVAENVAAEVSGVVDVMNRLRVVEGGPGGRHPGGAT